MFFKLAVRKKRFKKQHYIEICRTGWDELLFRTPATVNEGKAVIDGLVSQYIFANLPFAYFKKCNYNCKVR